jgi:hypothetical protein
MTDKEQILQLKDGECYIVPKSDYGKAEIWFKNGTYFLFEIPQYGGQPKFVEAYPPHRIDEMISKYESWT